MSKLSSFIRILGIFSCVLGFRNTKLPKRLRSLRISCLSYKMVYLTNIGLVLVIVLLSVGILLRLASLLQEKMVFDKMARVYNILAIMSLAIESVVTLLFWPFYFIDPKLVVNKELLLNGFKDTMLKQALMHIFPLCFTVFECCTNHIEITWIGRIVLVLFTIFYYCYSKYIVIQREKGWQYGFLRERSDLSIIFIFFLLMFLGYLAVEVFVRIKNRIKNIPKTIPREDKLRYIQLSDK